MMPEFGTPLDPKPLCANCGTPLLGEYCYACGQPVKGLVRHLSGVLGDVFDTVLNVDSRVLRTLPALFLHPGFLTREYFVGRRVRYVTPFRLMFFLCLAAFFALQLATDSGMSAVHFNPGCIGSNAQRCRAADNGTAAAGFNSKLDSSSLLGGVGYDSFQQATTRGDVEAREKQALTKIDRAGTDPDLPAIARGSLEVARAAVRDKATQRLAELDAAAKTAAPASTAGGSAAGAASATPRAEPSSNEGGRGDANLADGDTWNLPRDRIHLNWLPAFANDWLNQAGQRMHDNVIAIKDGSPARRRAAIQHLFASAFSLLPQTMFVLMPLFALLLTVFYIFKRRLYMEHLIVALLHSHAFIFLSLLLLVALHALKAWLLPHAAWLGVPLGLSSAAVWIWIFVYLFLMQKRVYGQDWFFTALKFCCVGICYSVLLSVALTFAFALSLASA